MDRTSQSPSSHGLQPTSTSPRPRGPERRRSLRSDRHFRVPSVSSEVPQSTAVHLRNYNSQTLRSFLAPPPGGYPNILYSRVVLSAPSSSHNLVDSGNQNPETLTGTGRHPTDMSLDVDTMSYEQLLQLEERIGKVRSGIKTSELHQFVKEIICCGEQDEEEKCVICQEQYVDGDVNGQLKCSHVYHMSCIVKWIEQNAVCPICRHRAAPF